MRRHRTIGFAVAILLGLGLAGTACGGDDEEEPPEDTAGLANPASVYCEEQGGTVELVEEEGGVVGYCNLPDGTRVDEWDFYRQSMSDSTAVGMANPAAVYCEEQGGVVSGPEPMCELPDGTVVDAWEYFREQSG